MAAGLPFPSSDENRFEAFCHAAVPSCELEGQARKNYRRAPTGAPYDAETYGDYRGRSGLILFEYKAGGDLSKIKSDLITSGAGQGDKLRRAARQCPGAVLYVLVMQARSTDRFVRDIQDFIIREKLPLQFIPFHLDETTLARWLTGRPDLQELVTPRTTPTIDGFIEELSKQGAPVNFLQYRNMLSLYVPPRQFASIRRKLEKHKIVFVIGPPHIGKTFTAAWLLWDDYRQGRHPRWLLPKKAGREPIPGAALPQWPEPPQSLADLISDNVSSSTTTYVEDPFGRTAEEEVEWSRLNPSEFLRWLTDHVVKTNEARVIVTSREAIFGRAIHADNKFEKLVVRLDAGVKLPLHAYNRSKKEMLVREYAESYCCEWLGRGGQVYRKIREAAVGLPTPGAIAFFCEISREDRTFEQASSHLKTAGEELVKAFSWEIAQLKERVLAVLLTAVRWGDVLVFVNVPPDLAGKDPFAVWDEAKLALAERVQLPTLGGEIEYVHPSYREAVAASLGHERVRRLFIRLCVWFSINTSPNVRRIAASWLAFSYEFLDADARGLLSRLAGDESPEVRRAAAGALPWAYENLDGDGRALLSRLARDRSAVVRGAAASALGWTYGKLDRDRRVLLWRLARDRSPVVRGETAQQLASEYGNLDADGRALLSCLAGDTSPDVRRKAAFQLALKCGELDGEGRALLSHLATDKNSGVRAAAAVGLADVRGNNELDADGQALLSPLSRDKSSAVRHAVAERLAYCYKKLDGDGRAMLSRLACDKSPVVRRAPAVWLAESYEMLDADGRALLSRLAGDKSPAVRRAAARRSR